MPKMEKSGVYDYWCCPTRAPTTGAGLLVLTNWCAATTRAEDNSFSTNWLPRHLVARHRFSWTTIKCHLVVRDCVLTYHNTCYSGVSHLHDVILCLSSEFCTNTELIKHPDPRQIGLIKKAKKIAL